MSGVEVRIAQSDQDLLDVIPLKQAADSECLGFDIGYERAFNKVIDIANYCEVWMARLGGQLVGYALGSLETDEAYRSEGIFVLPEHRSLGVGTRLKAAQVAFARELGCQLIWASVEKTNKPSIAVQQKNGFTHYSGDWYVASL